jgi:hypothetical protein
MQATRKVIGGQPSGLRRSFLFNGFFAKLVR